MRIIAGKYRGHGISSPSGSGTRPTTDRTRESIFNVISNMIDLDGLRVIDLFAGSGAMGLEALSRGAGFCLFVEENAKARASIRDNIEKLGVTGNTKLYRRDATKLGIAGTLLPFDFAFLDPPYNKGLGVRSVGSLLSGKWLADQAILVLEEHRDGFPNQLEGFKLLDDRSYGETRIGIFQMNGSNT